MRKNYVWCDTRVIAKWTIMFRAFVISQESSISGFYANCTRWFLRMHTGMRMCFNKLISVLSSVSYGDMCFPVVRQSPPARRRRISRRITRKGRISARYRRAQILIQSTCIHIDALAAPRGWNCAATSRTGVYTCNPERSVAVHSLPNVRFWNLWDTRFARLTHRSICVAHFDTSLGWFATETFAFLIRLHCLSRIIWRTDLGCSRRLLSRFVRITWVLLQFDFWHYFVNASRFCAIVIESFTNWQFICKTFSASYTQLSSSASVTYS